MFQTKYSTILSIATRNIINMVDKHNGVVFGSLVHQMLSKLNYYIGDIDVFFPSVGDMNAFVDTMDKFLTLMNNPVCARWNHSNWYTFSDYISTGKGNTMILYCPSFTNQRIHLSIVNMKEHFPTRELKDFPEICVNDVLKLDFLKNVYSNGVIYHKLQDVQNVELVNFEYSKPLRGYIQKYTYRGVKMTLIDSKESCRPSTDALTQAKDNYRKLGLVVIPLNRNGSNPCGKAPAVSNWASLSAKYNFEVNERCDNIGIVCGPTSGIVCIDVDVKDNGVKMFDLMCKHYGDLPIGPVQKTGNNGYHYIFKYDHTRMSEMKPKIKCPKLDGKPIGIDMWIQDCQFVASPSVNYSNGNVYKWKRPIESIDSLPKMPEWLYKLYFNEAIDATGRVLEANELESSSTSSMPKLAPLNSFASTESDLDSDESSEYESSYDSEESYEESEESTEEEPVVAKQSMFSNIKLKFELSSLSSNKMLLLGMIGIPIMLLVATCIAGIGFALVVFGIIASTVLIGTTLLGAGIAVTVVAYQSNWFNKTTNEITNNVTVNSTSTKTKKKVIHS